MAICWEIFALPNSEIFGCRCLWVGKWGLGEKFVYSKYEFGYVATDSL